VDREPPFICGQDRTFGSQCRDDLLQIVGGPFDQTVAKLGAGPATGTFCCHKSDGGASHGLWVAAKVVLTDTLNDPQNCAS
jgi:hypothetical protein